MKISKLLKLSLTFIFFSISTLTLAAEAPFKRPLELSVHRADSNGFNVSSVVVSSDTEAALIDAQFNLADARKIVADILRGGKKLTTVYVSHGDPDYYFGLEIIKQAFPDVKIYATQETLQHIKATEQQKLEFWGPLMGTNAPKQIVYPEVLKGDSFTVGNEELKIIGLEDHPEHTYVWIPSIKAVVGGVPVYGKLHVWIADAPTQQQRENWISILDEISALKPEVVIPGHAQSGAPSTLESVKFTRDYLVTYEKELAKAENSEALIKTMIKHYPELPVDDSIELSAKTVTGEMQW